MTYGIVLLAVISDTTFGGKSTASPGDDDGEHQF